MDSGRTPIGVRLDSKPRARARSRAALTRTLNNNNNSDVSSARAPDRATRVGWPDVVVVVDPLNVGTAT